MASVEVEVEDGFESGSFTTVTNADEVEIRQRIGPGEASFRLPAASPSDLSLIVPGREVKITLTLDDDSKINFGGVVGKSRRNGVGPTTVNLEVDVQSLNHLASTKIIHELVFLAETNYSDMLDSLWLALWPDVDRSGIQSTSDEHPDQLRWLYTDLARATNRITGKLLGGWVWWVEWTGAGNEKIVKAGEHNLSSTPYLINADDVHYSMGFAPRDWDYRNSVRVVGSNGGGPEPGEFGSDNFFSTWPVYGKYPPNDPADMRPMIMHDPQIKTNEEAERRALAEYWQRRLLWEGTLGVTSTFSDLKPGDIFELDLPNLGFSSENFAVVEKRDTYSRGIVEHEIKILERS